jgi:hypothetical protein
MTTIWNDNQSSGSERHHHVRARPIARNIALPHPSPEDCLNTEYPNVLVIDTGGGKYPTMTKRACEVLETSGQTTELLPYSLAGPARLCHIASVVIKAHFPHRDLPVLFVLNHVNLLDDPNENKSLAVPFNFKYHNWTQRWCCDCHNIASIWKLDCVEQQTTLPHSPWMNFAERNIGTLGAMVRNCHRTFNMPYKYHNWTQRWCCDCHNIASIRKLDWKLPDDIHLGYTQDISKFQFHIWEPIWYYEKVGKPLVNTWKKGCWMGFAHQSGDTFTYYI